MSTQVTKGARLLRARLRRINQTVPDFCEEHGFIRQQLQRALNGEQTSFSIDFCKKMAVATAGEVPPEAWGSDTLSDASPDEIGRVFPTHRKRAAGGVARADVGRLDGPANDGPVLVRGDFDQTGTG